MTKAEKHTSTSKFPTTENSTVCIVATGYAWENCVFNNPKHDYWTLNNMYEAGVKSEFFDEWFQLHRPGSGEGHVDDGPMRQFLQQWRKPVWVQQDWGDSMPVNYPWVYPIQAVLNEYCPKDHKGVPQPFFTNSVDYMICLALLRGYKEIQLYGVEFVSEIDDEYYKMRQSVNFYIGQAQALGVKVAVQPHSSLLKTEYWYAYESPKRDPFVRIMDENLQKVLQEKAKQEKTRHDLDKAINVLDGGRQTLEQLLKIIRLRGKGCQI